MYCIKIIIKKYYFLIIIKSDFPKELPVIKSIILEKGIS